MTALARALARAPFLVRDGGLATLLESMGWNLDDPLWSARVLLERPSAIGEVHCRYASAGAEILTTATYQATFEGLQARGVPAIEAERVFVAAVHLARQAAPPGVLVAGSVGSHGAFLGDGAEYRGGYDLTRAQLRDFHRPRLRTLAAHCDILAAETIPSLTEALAIADVLEELSAPPAWISMTSLDGVHDPEGRPLTAFATAMHDLAAVSAIGINCCAPEFVLPALRALGDATDKPLVAYPNSGERWCGEWTGEPWTPERYAEEACAWVRAGARIVGGCCRTTPEHTAALVARRNTFGAEEPSRVNPRSAPRP